MMMLQILRTTLSGLQKLSALKLDSSINFGYQGQQIQTWRGQVNHGPYVISDDSVSLIAGDRVLFDWRAQGGGDDADVFAYLLDENTGETRNSAIGPPTRQELEQPMAHNQVT